MIDTASPYLNKQGKNNKNIVAILGVVVVIVALIGGILILRQPKKTEQTQVAVVEKKEPSPTEKPKIDKKSVKIQVLNGTGTPGQAGVVVEALKKAEYNPDNIKTDNAKEFDTTVTTVTARASFEDVASDIKEVLKDTFDSITIDSSPLDKDSEFDVVIVTGGKKFEEATPTTSPSDSPTPSSVTPTITITPSPTPSQTTTTTPAP